MASWQTHLTVLFLKLRVKRKMTGQADIQKIRATLGRVSPVPPSGVRLEVDKVGGVAGEWVHPPERGVVGTMLYLHGGGYFACSPQTHRPITAGFARRGLRVFAPDYRLAPEHPFPAAVDDAVAAYRGLLAQGLAPDSIVVGGDSAGGGLTLSMLLTLRELGEPMPAAAMLFSPLTDLAATGASLVTNTKRDAMFHGADIAKVAGPYMGERDPKHPVASPLYADLSGLPPLLVHAGSDEVLLDDSTRLVDRAKAAGTDVVLQTWPVVPHVWQLFPLPESAESMNAAADFLRAALNSRTRVRAA